MNSFCPNCGAQRQNDLPICASCGVRLDETQRRHRRGNHSLTGFLLVVVGGVWLFVPFWPSSMGKLSIWQSHDACSSLLSVFAPSDCSNITMLWAIGLGAIVLGVITLLGAALRTEPPEPPPQRRSMPPAPTAPPVAPVENARPRPSDLVQTHAASPRLGPADRRIIAMGGIAVVIAGVLVLVGLKLNDGSAGPALVPTPPPPSFAAAATPTTGATPLGTAPSAVAVPIVACATTYGNGDIQQPQPASVTMTLPPELARRVAVFATNFDRLLAPREFTCTAEVGANGTSGLTVASYDQSASVIAENAAVSYGYVLDLACPLFAEAATLDKQQFDQSCAKPPAGEVVTREGKTVARFEDPAGLAGTGTQSGGSNSAIGAIWFVGGEPPMAAKITCLLPNEDRDICGLSVGTWLNAISSSSP